MIIHTPQLFPKLAVEQRTRDNNGASQIGGNLPKEWLHDNPGLFSLIVGAVGFPFGFTTIVVCGSELYTSMCAYMACAWWENKVTWKDAVRCARRADGGSTPSAICLPLVAGCRTTAVSIKLLIRGYCHWSAARQPAAVSAD